MQYGHQWAAGNAMHIEGCVTVPLELCSPRPDVTKYHLLDEILHTGRGRGGVIKQLKPLCDQVIWWPVVITSTLLFSHFCRFFFFWIDEVVNSLSNIIRNFLQ